MVASPWLRYIFATIGPIAMAATQFLLTIIMLHAMAPKEFGAFSFLLVGLQFSFGISNALFCAPLATLVAEKGARLRDGKILSLNTANFLFSAAMLVVFGLIALALSLSQISALLFGIYAALASFRWFLRAYAYAVDATYRTISSDIVYSTCLLPGAFLLNSNALSAAPLACFILLGGTLVGLIPFGRLMLRDQFTSISVINLSRYREVWTQHAKWSLTGVITTELTVNAHSYIVTLLAGSAAFAGIAASALIIRPTMVLLNALSEFERPRMAKHIGKHERSKALEMTSSFRLFLMIGWLGSVVLAFLLFSVAPQLLIPNAYDPTYVKLGALLWLIVVAIRIARTPESTVLQASGMFRWLAYCSMISSVFSIVAVLAFFLWGGPVWSIAGVACGELIMAGGIWHQIGRLRSR